MADKIFVPETKMAEEENLAQPDTNIQYEVALAPIGSALLGVALTASGGLILRGISGLIGFFFLAPLTISFLRHFLSRTSVKVQLPSKRALILLFIYSIYSYIFIMMLSISLVYEPAWPWFSSPFALLLTGHQRLMLAGMAFALTVVLIRCMWKIGQLEHNNALRLPTTLRLFAVPFLILAGTLLLYVGSFEIFGCFYIERDNSCHVFLPYAHTRPTFSIAGVAFVAFGTALYFQPTFIRELFTPARLRMLLIGAGIGILIVSSWPVGQFVTTEATSPDAATPEANALLTQQVRGQDYGRTGIQLGPAPKLPIARVWAFDTGLTEVRSGPVIVDGIAYFGAGDFKEKGAFYAVETTTGRMRWSFKISSTPTKPPAVIGDRVLFCAGNTIYALGANTGSLIWSRDANSDCSSPIVTDNRVIFVTGDGTIFECTLASGAVQWQYKFANSTSTPPILSSGMLYVAGGSQTPSTGMVFAINMASQRPLWRVDLKAFPIESFSYVSGSLIVGDVFGSIYRFDVASGRKVWAQSLPSPIASFAVTNKSVFVSTQSGGLHSLNFATGKQSWQALDHKVKFLSPPAVTEDSVVVSGWSSGTTYFFDAATGRLLTSYHFGDEVRCYSRPTVVGGVTYVGCNHGQLISLGYKYTTEEMMISTPSLNNATPVHSD